jgi:hypothetical protein
MNDIPEDRRFLRNIDDNTITWRFQVVGRRVFEGNVTSYLWTDKGVPITLSITTNKPIKTFEIPWGSIQTIEMSNNGD